MLSRRSALALASLASTFALALVACGGAPAEGPRPPAGPAASAAPADAGAGAGAEKEKAPPGKQKLDVAAEHKDFNESCMKQTKGSQEYCDCAWSQVKAVLGEDLAGREDPEKAARVRSEVARGCTSKVSENMVKDGYLAGCVGDRPETEAYCTCTWTEFRRQFSPGEMSDEQVVKGEKFSGARKSVVKTCGPKMPEPVAKDAFMKGCAKDASANDFCTCAWKEIRKLGSAAEIEAGMVDEGKMRTQTEAACGKLRPKAAGAGAGAGGAGSGGAGAGGAAKPAPSAAPKK